MELDEMKSAWQSLHRRLDEQHALNLQLFRDSKLDKARRRLRPLLVGQAIQASIGTLLAFGGAMFWTTRLHLPYLFVCGLLVHAYGLLLIAFAARTLYLVQRIDYAAPVMLIQRRLADQDRKAIAEFEQQGAVARFASSDHFVEGHRLLMLGLVEQGQRAAWRIVLFFRHDRRAQLAEAGAHPLHEAPFQRDALLLQLLAAKQVLLLLEMVARAFGQRIKALLDIAQAQA